MAAISGFHYQFLVVLHKSVNAWFTRTPKEQEYLTVFTEILSDFVECKEEGKVIIIQVKLTQSSKSIQSGLEELFSIHQVALSETPELISKLQYQIVSAKSELQAVKKTIKEWKPSSIQVENKAAIQNKLNIFLLFILTIFPVTVAFDWQALKLRLCTNDIEARTQNLYIASKMIQEGAKTSKLFWIAA